MELSFLKILQIRFDFEYGLKGIAFLMLLFCPSCANDPVDECNYTYSNSNNKYCVNGSIENTIEKNTRFIFYNADNKMFAESGFFRNGFRIGKWQYSDKAELQQIEWGYFKDSSLNFETNLFSYADSIKYENGRTKFKFAGNQGNIILSVSINGIFKDSLPEANYAKLTENDFARINFEVQKVETKTIQDSLHTIYLHDFYVFSKVNSREKGIIIKNAFSRFSTDLFIELAVRFDSTNSFLGTKLFDGVLTNSYFNGTRLYNPYRNP